MVHEYSIKWTVSGGPSSNGRPMKLVIVETSIPINCKPVISAIIVRFSMCSLGSRTMEF